MALLGGQQKESLSYNIVWTALFPENQPVATCRWAILSELLLTGHVLQCLDSEGFELFFLNSICFMWLAIWLGWFFFALQKLCHFHTGLSSGLDPQRLTAGMSQFQSCPIILGKASFAVSSEERNVFHPAVFRWAEGMAGSSKNGEWCSLGSGYHKWFLC